MATRPDPFLEKGDPDYEEMERKQRVRDAAGAALQRVEALARDAVQKRAPIEARWLQDLRLYYGRYDEITEKNLRDMRGQKSRAFIPLARAKTNIWEAELGDRLFPADDQNWGIAPTPVPELVESAEQAKREALEADAEAERLVEEHNQQAAAAAAQQQAAEGAPEQMAPEQAAAPPTDLLEQAEVAGRYAQEARQRETEAREIMAIASKRCDAMEREIKDQLSECNYAAHSRRAIADACRLGCGVMKGPLFSAAPRRAWEKDPGGENVYRLKPVASEKPEYRHVQLWHYFPDPNAQTPADREYDLERHVPNRRQLRKMARDLGFDRDAVRELLEEGPGHGTAEDLNYLTQLRSITNEGEAVTGRYIVWEFNGTLEVDEVCDMLRGLGQDEDAERFEAEHDPIDEIRVEMFFCQGKILKLTPDYILDSGESLYSVYSFSKTEGSILGALGVPALMADPLAALNAAWRMMLDNAALSVGPQIVIDKARIAPEDGDWRLVGRKVWEASGLDALNGQNKAFEIFTIPNNQAELAGIIEFALRFIDDITGLTLPGQGEDAPAAAQTVGGLAIQQNAINVVFRAAVKNFDDDMTTPNIRRLYDWNMQFNEKEEIKGDMKVEARGTSALLVKEIQSQHLLAIAQNWSTHPVLGVALKAYEAIRMSLQSLSINADEVLIPKDEFEQKLKDMAQAQPSPEEIRVKGAIEVAQINARSRTESSTVELQIAQIRERTEGMKLVQNGQLTIAELNAMIADKREERASKERIKAVEIGEERMREERAEAAGIPAVEASGKEIG